MLAVSLGLASGHGMRAGWAASRAMKSPAHAVVTAVPVFRATPSAKRLARGRYLVESVMACFGCHSPNAADLQPRPGMKGAGQVFPEKLPFRLVAPNITPDKQTGIGTWTDVQIAQAIRNGIAPDGHRLLPVMPYRSYRVLSDEDLKSIIVYLRTIPPVQNALPPSEIPPALLAGRTAAAGRPGIERMRARVRADLSTEAKRGAYLVALADCHTCHTPVDAQGRFLPGMDFAGGRILEGPWGRVASANITPDPSGISYYTKAMFFQALREGRLGARTLSPIMLSGYFRGMTDRDISAIFAYLKTLKPVKHHVDNVDPPTYCRLDGQMHGLGDLN